MVLYIKGVLVHGRSPGENGSHSKAARLQLDICVTVQPNKSQTQGHTVQREFTHKHMLYCDITGKILTSYPTTPDQTGHFVVQRQMQSETGLKKNLQAHCIQQEELEEKLYHFLAKDLGAVRLLDLPTAQPWTSSTHKPVPLTGCLTLAYQFLA
jgi:hypothetical protein